jgi:hypothetical protein
VICQPYLPASQEAGFLIEQGHDSGMVKIVLNHEVLSAWIVSTLWALGR